MSNQQINNTFSIDSLKAEIAILKNKLKDKDLVIADKDSTIADQGSTIADQGSEIDKLTTDIEAIKFQNEQLRRMIFGSKREYFESKIDSHQLTLQFEPEIAEIDEAVKAQRERIRVAYEPNKPKKSTKAA